MRGMIGLMFAALGAGALSLPLLGHSAELPAAIQACGLALGVCLLLAGAMLLWRPPRSGARVRIIHQAPATTWRAAR